MANSTDTPSFSLFDCQGSHHEMGWQQGDRYFESIEKVAATLSEIVPTQNAGLHKVLGLASAPITSSIGRVGKSTIGRDLQKHFPHHAERLKGISQGAGVPEHLLYVGQTIERILNVGVYSKPRAGACTAVAVTAGRSDSGEPVIAKNFDYPMVALDSYLVRRSSPTHGARTIDIGLSMMVGSHEGINEHGLALTYNYGHFKGKGKAAITITTIVQELLERCVDVDDAIETMSRMPRVGGALLMLADAKGNIASVELGPDSIGVRRGDALVHTNHAVTEGMQGNDIPWQATYPRWWPGTQLRGTRYHQSSDLRFQRATRMLDRNLKADEQYLISLLSDHGEGKKEGDDLSVCRHGSYYVTTCSLLLYPMSRRMKVCFGSPCSNNFQEIGFQGGFQNTNKEGLNGMSKFKGKISKNDLEGGFWQLISVEGEAYQLKNAEALLTVEGQSVEIEGAVETQSMGIGLAGSILNVESWKKA